MERPRTRGNAHQIAWTASRNKIFRDFPSAVFFRNATSLAALVKDNETHAKLNAHSHPYRRVTQ